MTRRWPNLGDRPRTMTIRDHQGAASSIVVSVGSSIGRLFLNRTSKKEEAVGVRPVELTPPHKIVEAVGSVPNDPAGRKWGL